MRRLQILLLTLITMLVLAAQMVFRFEGFWKMKNWNRATRREMWKHIKASGLVRQICWLFRYRVKPLSRAMLYVPLVPILGLTGVRTALFAQKQPGGVLAIEDMSRSTGDRWFVDSGSSTGADDTGYGTSPDKPFLTLDYAIGVAAANNGDIIYVMPGHSETYSTTGTKVTFDKAGQTIICLGEGADRPTFTFGHVDATMVMSAASVVFKNFLFVTSVDSVVTYMTVSGADCTVEGEMRDAANVEVIDGLTVTGNRFKAKIVHHGDRATGDANNSSIALNGVDGANIYIEAFGIAQVGIVDMRSAASHEVVVSGVFEVVGTTNFSKTVVDTITGSTYQALGFDIAAGKRFSGNTITAKHSIDDFTVSALAAGAIDATAIADNAIDAGAIAANAIAAAKIASGAITNAKFAAGAIDAAAIATGAIDADAIADDAIDAGAIATGAITAAKFAAGAIDAAAIANGAIDATAIATGAIDADAIADDAIDAGAIADGAIDAGAIAANAITSAKIAAGAITAGTFAAGAIDDAAIDTGAITSAKFAAGAINAAAVADGAIDAATFAAGAIDAAAIAAAAIDAATFAADALQAIEDECEDAFQTAKGSKVLVTKTIAGTAIDSGAATDVTAVSTGGVIFVEEIILSTAAGLTDATNLNVVVNGNAYGPATIAAETIANLGANVTVKGSAASVTPLKPFELESGAKIQVQATVMDVGAGSLKVTIIGTRMADGADLVAA